MTSAARPRAAAALVLALVGVACGAIQGEARTVSPVNACPDSPCEGYAEIAPGKGKPQCTSGRCEYGVGSLSYPFRIVVHVPTSYPESGAGLSFVFTSEDLRRTNVTARCAPPSCLPIDPREARGRYQFTGDELTERITGLAVRGLVSVPVRVTFLPLLGTTGQVEASPLGLPVEPTFVSSAFESTTPDSDPQLVYARPIAPGRYLRLVYPEPPFDAYLPPIVSVPTRYAEDLFVDRSSFDDPEGTSRVALVRRAEGLDGWRIWLSDGVTGQRLSTLHTLAGTEAEVRLHTSGQSAAPPSTALRDNVEVIVAPPGDWVGVPRLVSTLIGGAGLRPLNVPSVPPPTRVTGLVAVRTPGASSAAGVPARVAFRSTALLQQSGDSSQLLQYGAELMTDGSGLFATVLPPGTYDMTVEPDPATGRGKTTQSVEISASPTDPGTGVAINVEPPPRTTVRGRAVLADGRVLADAQVIASASPEAGGPRRLRPRPGTGRTGLDGSFSLSLDQGAYQIAVVPQEGSGFPRVVTLADVSGDVVVLPDVDVPAPVKLAFRLANPSAFLPVANAVVRVFADMPGGSEIEVGRAISNADGKVEILLAREPR